eukprot:CAMPEP_0118832704 /NCGR_PEP_ID=MMETSP1162-20130426/40113_1 /TAXON_ID=33656 /ORGANISM="Phaeocystis Sp, Strain CCMP2710" /LENGTH=131 /DNA_ID=CAMNT_0006764323 /DNA_START=38 /DNA_END=430 /DNA_ORIENTATION=-
MALCGAESVHAASFRGATSRTASRCSRGALRLLCQVGGLPLEHMQQRLRALHDLGVRAFRLLDRLVVLVAGGDLAREVVVDSRETLGQDAQVVLDLGFLLFVGGDRGVELFSLASQLLYARNQFRVVILQR